jgi:hypothetical protein
LQKRHRGGEARVRCVRVLRMVCTHDLHRVCDTLTPAARDRVHVINIAQSVGKGELIEREVRGDDVMVVGKVDRVRLSIGVDQS